MLKYTLKAFWNFEILADILLAAWGEYYNICIYHYSFLNGIICSCITCMERNNDISFFYAVIFYSTVYEFQTGEFNFHGCIIGKLGKVFALAQTAAGLAPKSLARRRRDLDNHLGAILKTGSACPVARQLLAKIANARDQLFTFCEAPGGIAVTNNQCERLLRPAVIQRKVTNGYRSAWAAQMEAMARTATGTAELAGKPRFETILAAFN